MLTRLRERVERLVNPDIDFPTAPDIALGIAQGDIIDVAREYHIDAVVNAANLEMVSGGGVCGAIYDAAGKDALEAETAPLSVKPRAAMVTSGYMLSKFIIHTAAPQWNQTLTQTEDLIHNYVSALRTAQHVGATSIAIPLLGAGIYGWPAELSATAAVYATLTVINSPQTKLRQGDPLTRIFLVAFTEGHRELLLAATKRELSERGPS
jgi:O-acetyl-ADP-ribose deacetylase (regulator of RNase III)